jgi:hypothetical protein
MLHNPHNRNVLKVRMCILGTRYILYLLLLCQVYFKKNPLFWLFKKNKKNHDKTYFQDLFLLSHASPFDMTYVIYIDVTTESHHIY